MKNTLSSSEWHISENGGEKRLLITDINYWWTKQLLISNHNHSKTEEPSLQLHRYRGTGKKHTGTSSRLTYRTTNVFKETLGKHEGKNEAENGLNVTTRTTAEDGRDGKAFSSSKHWNDYLKTRITSLLKVFSAPQKHTNLADYNQNFSHFRFGSDFICNVAYPAELSFQFPFNQWLGASRKDICKLFIQFRKSIDSHHCNDLTNTTRQKAFFFLLVEVVSYSSY